MQLSHLLLTVENIAHPAAQLQGGSWSGCPLGIWARLSAVHVNLSDGEITVMCCWGRKCFHAPGSNLPWHKKFPTLLVFQKTVSLKRVTATSEDTSTLSFRPYLRLLPAGPCPASAYLSICLETRSHFE